MNAPVQREPSFQSLIETTKLVNASTHSIDVRLRSPMGLHRIQAPPLGTIEVPKNWTERGIDSTGKPSIRSTVEQELPFCVDPEHKNVELAKKALAAGREFPPLPKRDQSPYAIPPEQHARQ